LGDSTLSQKVEAAEILRKNNLKIFHL